jgi:hypothetical protein
MHLPQTPEGGLRRKVRVGREQLFDNLANIARWRRRAIKNGANQQ